MLVHPCHSACSKPLAGFKKDLVDYCTFTHVLLHSSVGTLLLLLRKDIVGLLAELNRLVRPRAWNAG